MSKLDETLKERDEVRTIILNSRNLLANKQSLQVKLKSEIEELSRELFKYEKLLVDLSGKAAALLHADCAGICGSVHPRMLPEMGAAEIKDGMS